MKHKINRSTFYDPNNKRIDVLDNRYYFKADNPEIFYPSVTTVLDAFPKGPALTTWHKSLGFNADIVLAKAAEKGSRIHDAIKEYVDGKKLVFGEVVNGLFHSNYSLEEWEMISRFVEFWTTYKPKLIAAEVTIVSELYRLGGTLDLVFELNNENWVLDTKTGNNIYDSHEFQIAAYAKMWNEENPDYAVDRCGILHLDALTRGADKQGKKIQGKGWQLKEFDRHYGEAWKIFKGLRLVWDDINPNYKPVIYSMETEFQLESLDNSELVANAKINS